MTYDAWRATDMNDPVRDAERPDEHTELPALAHADLEAFRSWLGSRRGYSTHQDVDELVAKRPGHDCCWWNLYRDSYRGDHWRASGGVREAERLVRDWNERRVG